MYPNGPIPPLWPVWKDPEERDPDKMGDLAKERHGIEDGFDEESATYLDKETIVAHKRTDYAPEQVGCGEKFHPEYAAQGKGSPCGPDASQRTYEAAPVEKGGTNPDLEKAEQDARKAPVNEAEFLAEQELLDNLPNVGFVDGTLIE